MERRLAAIFAADVVGFSRLMGQDEEGTLDALRALREELLDPKIEQHNGRTVKLMGDGVLVEFASVVDAVRCAVEIQQGTLSRNRDVPQARRIELRIGINLGDVIVEDDDIFGEGVNVAARLEGLADPGGICIARSVRNQVAGKLKYQFEDWGEQELKNITQPVHVFSVRFEGQPKSKYRRQRKSTAAVKRIALAASFMLVVVAIGAVAVWLVYFQSAVEPELSIAVLPFANQSDSSEDQYLSDGITEDIIAGLGRFPNLIVLSRNAVFAYKGKAIPPEEISEELKIRYLVDGSVRRAGDRIRVTAQLSDAQRGALLWSGRFDEGMGDIFAIQDEITHRIVGTLIGRLDLVEQERAFAKPTENLDAYDYLLRGRSFFYENTRTTNHKAQDLFDKAIELDPEFASAYAWLARSYLESALYGWTEWPDRASANAYDYAQRAVTIEDTSPMPHSVLATIQILKLRHDLALNEADRALELNHNHAEGHAIRGYVLVLRGDLEEAIVALETAKSFNPQLVPSMAIYLGWAYFLSGKLDQATRQFEEMLVHSPDYPYIRVGLAAVAGERGDAESQVDALRNLRRALPFFDSTNFVQQFRTPEHQEKIAAALVAAGLP